MPFPHDSRFVTLLLQYPWKRCLLTIEYVSIAPHPIPVAEFSGQQHRAGWRTNGVGNKGIKKQCAFISETVVGCQYQAVVVSAYCPLCMVV